MEIIAEISKIKSSLSSFSDSYHSILQIVNQILSVLENQKRRAEGVIEHSKKQMIDISYIQEQAQSEAVGYREKKNSAHIEVQYHQSQMDYILNNPIPVSRIDDDGNEVTEYEIDEAAYNVEAEKRDRWAQEEEFNRQKESECLSIVDDCQDLGYEVLQKYTKANQFYDLATKGIVKINDHKKEFEGQSGKNKQSLQQVISDLTDYVNSMPFAGL